MKIYNGIDLVEIERFYRLKPTILKRFMQRVLTTAEQAEVGGSIEKLAGKFAAKEAAAKALGCGIGEVKWVDIEILSDVNGKPEIRFHHAAENVTAHLRIIQRSVSISHTRSLAIALVMLLAEE
jgi:holo-[acyl-carrier protein] synthase